jgi:hypothetical protein
MNELGGEDYNDTGAAICCISGINNDISIKTRISRTSHAINTIWKITDS